ncbi:restriction endonuclease subunit S [Mannheimia cairinae]|uniref:restriction endonuclease subunit S n=1 Tax=Mannheimia cairinae TaxID=3025936 RepID=UPI00235E65DF|nr:restriction endonuclease subunit S [Mannheimia cairinae]
MPKSWEWVRLDEITSKITDGSHNPPPNNLSGIPILSAANIFNHEIQFSSASRWVSIEQWEIENQRTEIQLNDVLLTIVGTIGRTAIVKSNAKFALQRSIAVLKPILVNSEYISYALQSAFLLDLMVSNSKGTAQKGIYLNTLKELIFPLPPINEQHRIVAKVEELLPFIEQYDKQEQTLKTLNKNFPEQLKKSILQAAIQGKLTEQLPTDEPAGELLKRIEAEKMRLISEGKLKKPRVRDNSQNEKFDPPFEIPQGWEWVRLGELIELISGQDLTPEYYSKEEIGIPYITGASNFINNKLEINRYTNRASKIANKGDLLITCKGTIGEMLFLEQDKVHIARQIMAIKTYPYLNKYFLKFYLHNYIDKLKSVAKSMIPGISRNDILDILFPLPPFEEQKRIVKKVELLLSQIERL